MFEMRFNGSIKIISFCLVKQSQRERDRETERERERERETLKIVSILNLLQAQQVLPYFKPNL